MAFLTGHIVNGNFSTPCTLGANSFVYSIDNGNFSTPLLEPTLLFTPLTMWPVKNAKITQNSRMSYMEEKVIAIHTITITFSSMPDISSSTLQALYLKISYTGKLFWDLEWPHCQWSSLSICPPITTETRVNYIERI